MNMELIITKCVALILLLCTLIFTAFRKYSTTTNLNASFGNLMKRANAFISGLFLASSLVYLLPESYKLHNYNEEEKTVAVEQNEFPWIFSVFCVTFAILLLYFQTIVSSTSEVIAKQYYLIEMLLMNQDCTTTQKQHQQNPQQIQPESYNCYSHNLPRSSTVPNQSQFPFQTLAQDASFYGTMNQQQQQFYSSIAENTNKAALLNSHFNAQRKPSMDNYAAYQFGRKGDFVSAQHFFENSIPAQYFYVIYAFPSFIECTAIGLQTEVFSAVMLSIFVIFRKWCEVIHIQMYTKSHLTFRRAPLSTTFIALYALSNLLGIAFGWFALKYFNYLFQAVLASISAGAFFALAVHDFQLAEFTRFSADKYSKIIIFTSSIALVNLAWFAQKQNL